MFLNLRQIAGTPLKKVGKRLKFWDKSHKSQPAKDVFVRQESGSSAFKTPRASANEVMEPATGTIYIDHDPFTGELMPTRINPALKDHQGIFEEGWRRFDKALTFEERQQALNAIVHSVSSNAKGDCVGISRAVVERLRTRQPVHLADYAHLNGTLVSETTSNYMPGLLSKRKDKLIDIPGSHFHGKSEAEFYAFLGPKMGLRRMVKDEWKALEESYLKEYGINEAGYNIAHSIDDVANALRNAGDGAIGYVYPGSHVLPIVNIKGDLFAIPNNWDGPPDATHLTAEICRSMKGNSDRLAYAITNHKVKL
jgi:hypothetical protein